MTKELLTQSIIELLEEFIEYKYEEAARVYTGVHGNHSANSNIVKQTATLENFLSFLQSKI
jgi:hypothetical protein